VLDLRLLLAFPLVLDLRLLLPFLLLRDLRLLLLFPLLLPLPELLKVLAKAFQPKEEEKLQEVKLRVQMLDQIRKQRILDLILAKQQAKL
jgi:hypothetical protein